MNKLTENDFIEAADFLGCSPAAVKAVSEVESRGEGFYPDGFPVILFERHKFYKYTNGRFAESYPEICNREPGGYGQPGANQKRKYKLAYSLAPEAAMKSCSWGKFQIMGFNYAVCGFENVALFVEAMKKGEAEQLKAFCSFVKGSNLSRFLKTLDWRRFAAAYNGVFYRKNNYDKKLEAAYNKYARTTGTGKVKPTAIITEGEQFTGEENAAAPPTPPPQTPDTAGTTAGTLAAEPTPPGNSALKDFSDKYLKHFKNDSVKNILLVIASRITANAAALWSIGFTGKVLIFLIAFAAIIPIVWAIVKYKSRLFGWIKTIGDSLFTS